MRFSLLLGLLGAMALGSWEHHALAAATNAPPRRVLILHSFGREYAPFSIMSATFRTELARQSRLPVQFHEASVEMALLNKGENEQAVVAYLQALFAERRLDLIATMGGPATIFLNRHRHEFRPEVPLLATMDARRLVEVGQLTNAVLVPLQLDLLGLVDDILQLRPATTNIFVVLGAGPMERYWAAQAQRDFIPLTNRITFTYWNDLSLDAMCRRGASLPPNSAVLYGNMIIDAAGIPYEHEAALKALHAECSAPLFGVYEHELGLGVIGGRLASMTTWGQRAAKTALRVLDGEPLARIQCPPTIAEPAAYDWRELQRWNIPKDRLPPGSTVLFRQPTTWEEHRWLIIAVLLITLLESALIILLVFNLTRRRRAERLLRESEYRLRLAAEAAGAGLWSLNLATNVFWLTTQTRRLFGFPEDQTITLERFLAVVHPDDRDLIHQTLKGALESRGDTSVKYRILRPDATVAWIAARSSLQCGPSGKPETLTGVSTDITEQHRNAEEMQRLQVEAWHADRVARTGVITSSLAHELNQPLAATLTAAQAGLRFMAAQRHDPNDIREILESIVQDAKRAGSVVSGLRAMLRRQTSQRERINLADAVRGIVDLLHTELLTHHVHLSVQCPPDCHVLADKTQIQQVLLNLLMNAIEAVQQLPDGERRIEIAAARDGADTVQVTVSDSGPGIVPEDAAKLFDAFWTTKSQGLGIGLAICRSILESHRGRIWLARSQPGQTTFCFTLPLDPGP